MSKQQIAAVGKSSLYEVGALFLRLGFTAFGGPAAHVSIMEDEIVRRRGWLSRQQLLDLLGVVNLIPGPNSTEMAIHVGYVRAGWPGFVVAGCAFILPAAVMVAALAWAYQRFGGLPQFAGLLYGMKPVVIAVIAQALWRLGRTAVKTPWLGLLGLLVAAAGAPGADPLALLLGGGVVAGLFQWLGSGRFFGEKTLLTNDATPERMDLPTSAARVARQPSKTLKPLLIMLLLVGAILAFAYSVGRIGTTADNQYSLGAMFLYFLKIGSVLYGSGYVLLAFLQTDLVHQWGWLTTGQLLDATAAGQVTPGPLFTTATFIGYLKGGLLGATLATLGMFLPAFVFVALGSALMLRLRESPVTGAFWTVNVSALALMAVVTWQLGQAAVVDVTSAVLAFGGLVLLLWFRVNSVWLVLAGALIGLGLAMAGMAF